MSDEKENINYVEPKEDSTSIDETLKEQGDRFDNLPKTPSLLDRLSARAYSAALDTLGGLISAARDAKNKVDAFVKTQKEELSRIAGELDARRQSLDAREEGLNTREKDLDAREQELNALEEKLNQTREEISKDYQNKKSEIESQGESLGKREEDASSLMERATELEAAFRDKNGISPEIPQDYLLRDQKIIEYMKTLKAEADRIYALTTRTGVEESREDKKARTDHYEELMAAWIGACSRYRDSLTEQESSTITVGGKSLSKVLEDYTKELFPKFDKENKRLHDKADRLNNNNNGFDERIARLGYMARLGYGLGSLDELRMSYVSAVPEYEYADSHENGEKKDYIRSGISILYSAANLERRYANLDNGTRVLKNGDILKATEPEEKIADVAQVIYNIKDAREGKHVENDTKDDDESR